MELVQGPVRFDPGKHHYYVTDSGKEARLHSVSSVISTVYNKKSWDGVNPDVIENARERGERVDRYIEEYISTGAVTIPYSEREDVVERFEIARPLIHNITASKYVRTQQIMYSIADGVAGTCDMVVADDAVVDLKCTYQMEHSWKLQLGAYCEYGNCDHAMILHVSPKVYRDEGARLIEYDAAECRKLWRRAVEWWKEIQAMERSEAFFFKV